MKVKSWDRWGYPEYMTEDEAQWATISHDWDHHDRESIHRRLWHQELQEAWLHGYSEIDCAESRVHITALETDRFQPKPSRDIRSEKTRDYRKRRPKAKKYIPDVAVSAGLLFCLFGGQS